MILRCETILCTTINQITQLLITKLIIMKPREILDYLLPIFEEDPEQLRLELRCQFPNLQLCEISGYYYHGYSELIKAIAEIKGENLSLLI